MNDPKASDGKHAMCGARIVKGELQSAVQEYRRQTDGRSILLVGLLHLAEPDYFGEIAKVVLEAENSGHTVYMEGTRIQEYTDVPSEEERAAIIQHDKALDIQYREVPKLLGIPWIYQGDSALAPYPSTWKSSDLNELQAIRLLGPANATVTAPGLALYRWLNQDRGDGMRAAAQFAAVRRTWVRGYFRTFVKEGGESQPPLRRFLLRVLRKPSPVKPWLNAIIYSHREHLAALCALGDGGNVVLLWNPGHMVGIGEVLARNGFEPGEPTWYTACREKFESVDLKEKVAK